MKSIRGVLFDAGNTLIRVRGSVGGVYAEVARRHGIVADAGTLEAAFRQVFRERKSGFVSEVSRPHTPERERAWWRALVEQVFRVAGDGKAPQDRFEPFFEELYPAFERPEHWEVFPDVVPCLESLSARGVSMGVVSNWDSRLHAVLRGLGLAPAFRFVLVSAEFGAEKPDAAIFLEGARRLALEPAEVVHVGDLIGDDVRGAARAGLRAVLVARDGSCPVEVPCVSDLRELPGVIRG